VSEANEHDGAIGTPTLSIPVGGIQFVPKYRKKDYYFITHTNQKHIYACKHQLYCYKKNFN
jgi:hypothetical protein